MCILVEMEFLSHVVAIEIALPKICACQVFALSPSIDDAMHLILFVSFVFALLSQVHSLYFYLEGSQTRCFLEDLPKDTLVVGIFHLPPRH